MTNQEYRERRDEILNSLSDSSASRGWLDSKSGSEDTYPRQDLVGIAKQAIDRLFLDVFGEDDNDVSIDNSEAEVYEFSRNQLRQQLRTTIAGKEGGDENSNSI